ncbi:hypothetical protein [Chitinilyticum aquatile]|uniref:hypothetical protein n=1 Tax=Chitinilyticum aquatile TaxID=362520 RepID=UPI000408E62C|nr:hypothetical protein [Chitinilyticum aquatile]
MGSKSSNSTTQNITTNDRQIAVDNGLGIAGDGNILTITTNNTSTDHGAIEEAAKITLQSIDANSTALKDVLTANALSQKQAYDFSLKVNDSAFAAIGEAHSVTGKISSEAMKAVENANKTALTETEKAWSKADETNRLAVQSINSAWNNAKAAADGKTLGDLKPIMFAVIGVFGLFVISKGGWR